jgi:hypothetical protein
MLKFSALMLLGVISMGLFMEIIKGEKTTKNSSLYFPSMCYKWLFWQEE